RFLAVLLGGSLLFATAWYIVHKFQVRRHAASLLHYASLAESQKRLDRATRFVGLYVNLIPNDTEARARFGLLLEQVDQSPRTRAGAMRVFEQVLLREPNRGDIRRRLIAHAVDLGQYDDALQHLDILMKIQPDDAELEHWGGVCLEARGAYADAV